MTPSPSPEEAGWGKRACLTSVLLGPKSTDPNLEAEAPSVAVWLKIQVCAPEIGLVALLPVRRGGRRFGASRLRCPSGLGVVRPTSSSIL